MAEIGTIPITLKVKQGLGWFWKYVPKAKPRRVILLYHSVGSGRCATEVEEFAAQMHWLSIHAEVMSIDDLLAGKGNAGLSIAITFDDGYASLFSVVQPILGPLKFTAAVYVNTGMLSQTKERNLSDPSMGHYPEEDFMTWGEVEQLHQSGWTIGSHGVDHIDLTTADSVELEHQLTASKNAIEKRLDINCLHFAYPWGKYDGHTINALKEVQYRSAVAAVHGAVTRKNGCYGIPRMDVRREYSMADFEAIIRGHWDFLAFIQKVRRAVREQ